MSKQALRAFTVSADDCESSVLVFAETPARAKYFAKRSDWMYDCDWVDMRVHRASLADDQANVYGLGVVEPGGPGERTTAIERLMRLLGWYEIDGSVDECPACGLNEWSNIPESKVCHEIADGELVCGDCAKDYAAKSDSVPCVASPNP